MASLGNLYPNLPGMLIEFKDGGSSLRFDDTDVSTDSVLLLGTAVDGPLMEPVAVDIESAELIFGSDYNSMTGVPNGSTLIHAFKQAYEAGCRDIRLMRISGAAATNVLETAGASVSNTERVDEEEIGYIEGNEVTVIALPIVPSGTLKVGADYKVYAKGKRVATSCPLSEGKNVTVPANICDAGATIEVKYNQLEDVTKTLTAEIVSLGGSERGVAIPGEVKSVTTVHEGSVKTTLVVDSNYKFNNGKLVITGVKEELKMGNKVTITYVETVTTSLSKKEQAKTSEQVIQLAKVLTKDNEPILYINNGKILDTNTYTYNRVANTIAIKKENFKKDQPISVSYFVTNNLNDVKNSITIESYFAGEVYNEGEIIVAPLNDAKGVKIGTKVTITKPISKQTSAELPQVYTSINYPTFGSLVDAINANNGTYKASTFNEDELTDNLVPYNSFFSNGEDGTVISKDEMFKALSGVRDSSGYITTQGAYQLLENYQVDSVVPVGVYADDILSDKHQNFAYELALFCTISSYKNKTTLGAISMKPLKDTSLAGIQKYAKYLASFNNVYYLKDATGSDITDLNGDKMDLGKYISVCAGPGIRFNHKVNSLKEANTAVMYMAYSSTLQPQSAPTNKMITGSTGLKFNFSNSQLNDIVGNRLVTFQLKYANNGQPYAGAFCVDGPTAARPNSEYARLTTVRVIRDVSDSIREVADPYIGEANTIEQRNALSAAISKRLDLLTEKGVILDASFTLVSTALDQLLGQASLELGIVAPQELRKITTVIGLKSAS